MPGSRLFEQLGLFVVPNFLESFAGIELCRAMEQAPAEKALVARADGVECLDEESRKVESSILPKEARSQLKARFRELAPALAEHFGCSILGCESPTYLIYKEGDFFKPHTDGGGDQVRHEIRLRRVSAVLFLNRQSQEPAEGAYGGGKLTFYGLLDGPQWEKCGLSLEAEAGLLVAFPSTQFHEVTPVSHGKRFTIVTWFFGPESR
jgi:SM-20-related protein